MNPEKTGEIRQAIRGEGLDGWLFCNFRHRDRLADEILGVDPNITNSRLWLYAVPAVEGLGETSEALAILHAVEPGILDSALPGTRVFYRSREELLERLAPLGGKRWGCHFSPFITALSCLDAGTAALLREAGLVLVPAEGLIQRFKGLLDSAGIEAHERAARHLYEIVELAWAKVKQSFAAGAALYEGEIQRFMLEAFEQRGLVTDHPPIVAAGPNSANPHYDSGAMARNGAAGPAGARFAENDIIQFDLWAKESGGIYADISWVGVYGKAAPPGAEQAFGRLAQAREGAYRFIEDELAAGRRPPGAEVDRKARDILAGFGYAGAIRHRTGHGIDTEVHGSGVNMDSVEFPDYRPLLDGSCFSLEPGIYFTGFGMRTEINVYVRDGRPVISGKERQFALLLC
jgi:Xaa-Pro aminopeptidase